MLLTTIIHCRSNNGSTNLGSLTVGAKVDTIGSLSAKGAAISVVIGASASAEIGNLTLLNGSTLTNNGQLSISGTYTGGTISQGDGAILTLADAAVVDVGRLTNTITETAPTNAEGTAISGRVIVNGDFTLASGGKVNTADNVRFTYNGFSYSGSLSEGNLAGTISGGYYRVVDGDEVTYSTASADTSITHIEVIGTLKGVKDSSITTSIPITGNGSVAVDGVLETHVADLDQFTGTISLTGTSTDNLAAIKFGNSNAHLTQVSKIQLNANSYISGWSDLNFNYNLEFNGGFLLANQGSWVGANHLLSDSSIQVHKSANITGAFTAEAGKVLSIQASTFSEGAANPVLTFSGTVGKLDGATLQIEDGAKVAVTGSNGGNAQIAGAIVVKGGGTLELTSQDTLGYGGDYAGNYTDSITLEGSTTTVGGVSTSKVATLKLTATQTLTTNLILKGNTSITGSAMNSFDGSITVTGTNNIIGNEVQARKLLLINVVNADDSLQMADITKSTDDTRACSFTKQGAGLLTITGDVGAADPDGAVSGTNNKAIKNVTVEAGKMEVQGAFYGNLTQQGGETVLGGRSTITTMDCTGGSVEMKGATATSSIATLTGSGSLKVSGDTGVTDASGFSGSLESGAVLSISSGVKRLKELKINSGGQVWAFTGTDEGSNAITSVKIEEVALNGGIAGIYINDSDSNATVQTDSLVVSAASTLYADLTLADNAGLVVNVGGVTAETATAICSLNGALTLGSELSLTLSNLGKFKAGESIKLFSGVTGVTYTIPTTGVETDIAALSEDVGTTGTLDATGVDASQIFSNVDPGYFKLTYTGTADGGIVALVAQRAVPEPTTATLSLLALMGLAARRRRRKA